MLMSLCVCASLSIPDILLLGVLCDGDTLAVGFELMLDDFSVGVVLHTESVVQDAGDVIVPEEEEGQAGLVALTSHFTFIS